MTERLLNKAFRMLPYAVRRTVIKLREPKKFELLTGLRHAEPEQLNAPTFKPFIDRECVFVHIPKAAGISIGYGFFERHTGNHTTIAEYQIAFDRREFEKFFKFTFVRNPWDRLLSAFVFLKNGGRNEIDRRWADQHLTPFDDFRDFVLEWVNERNVRKGVHMMPQYRFLTTPGSPRLRVDFVGFFENIEADYELLRRKLGFGTGLGRENKTRGKDAEYRSYYDDEMKEIVAAAYMRDIELLGYDFENTSLERQLTGRSERTGVPGA